MSFFSYFSLHINYSISHNNLPNITLSVKVIERYVIFRLKSDTNQLDINKKPLLLESGFN